MLIANIFSYFVKNHMCSHYVVWLSRSGSWNLAMLVLQRNVNQTSDNFYKTSICYGITWGLTYVATAAGIYKKLV